MRRTYRRRSSARSLTRRTTQRFWLDLYIDPTAVATLAPVSFDLLPAISATFDVTRRDIAVLRCVGDLVGVEIATTAANIPSTLTAGWIIIEGSTPIANLDPAANTGPQKSWIHQENWIWPYAAAPANPTQQIASMRHIDFSCNRKIRSNTENFLLVVGSHGVVSPANSWSIAGHLRTLIQVP